MTTKEQQDWLLQIGQTIKKVMPNFYGSIHFNLNPKKDFVNVTVEQQFLLSKPKQ